MNSKADRYRDNVKRHMDGGSKGTIVMVSIFVLSAVLSALFFWRHSTGVFAGIPWIFATVLGLLVGLIPSELAFFGWKDIQKKKEDMTGPQTTAANAGMWLGIIFSVMNIAGLFLTSFPGVPIAVQEITPWLALLALAMPIPTQLILFARFATNEQSVIEAKQRARLNAAKHSAAIKAEEARIGAVLEGMDAELELVLDNYGQETGRENAQTALTSGTRNIMDGFYDRQHGRHLPPGDPGRHYAPDLSKATYDDMISAIAARIASGEITLPVARPVSNSTHSAAAHTPPAPGQGNGASGPKLGAQGADARNPM